MAPKAKTEAKKQPVAEAALEEVVVATPAVQPPPTQATPVAIVPTDPAAIFTILMQMQSQMEQLKRSQTAAPTPAPPAPPADVPAKKSIQKVIIIIHNELFIHFVL
jgi:hypothetical protein